VNWEGRGGSFAEALKVPEVRTDLYVLGAIADQMDVHLGLPDAPSARAELASLGSWRGTRPEPPAVAAAWPDGPPAQPIDGSGIVDVRLATWHQLLDSGRMQDGEPSLAGTARPAVARMSAATAAEVGVADGDKVTVATDRGSVTVPAEIMPMADHVVWLPAAGLPQGAPGADRAGAPYPARDAGSTIGAELGAGHGATVTLRRPA
jgi:NADH-quinone oxidoreductase subunit G